MSLSSTERLSEKEFDRHIFTGSTDEERSLVCPTELVPSNTIERNDGWRAFQIEGILDFYNNWEFLKLHTIKAPILLQEQYPI